MLDHYICYDIGNPSSGLSGRRFIMAKANETPSTDPVTDAIVGALKAVTGDSLKGLAPTRAVEGVSFYGTITAYRALAATAKKVCRLVEKHGAKTVLICGS